jgi:hypothetical protein
MRYADLSLFYFIKESTRDGYVLWGEGIVTPSAPSARTVRSENLGDGLRVLRIAVEFDVAATTLQRDVFRYQRGPAVTEDVHLGLTRRPAVLAVPPYTWLGTTTAAELHQFVRPRKADAVGAGAEGLSAGERERVERVLARLAFFVSFDFRGEDASRLGDVVLVDYPSQEPAPVSAGPSRREGEKGKAVEPALSRSERVVHM